MQDELLLHLYSPSCIGQETAKGPFGLPVKLPLAHLSTTHRASERKFSRGYEGRYRAPKSYWAPQALSGPMPLNHFLSDGCRSSFKSEWDNDIRIQLEPMKNTTRHKIGLNPARGSGGAL